MKGLWAKTFVATLVVGAVALGAAMVVPQTPNDVQAAPNQYDLALVGPTSWGTIEFAVTTRSKKLSIVSVTTRCDDGSAFGIVHRFNSSQWAQRGGVTSVYSGYTPGLACEAWAFDASDGQQDFMTPDSNVVDITAA